MNHVVVAPFSNSDIRDWPAGHYRALIARMVREWDGTIHVIGAPEQAIRAREVLRTFDSSRVISDCGRGSWDAALDRVRSAVCVIGNNSGIAHLAAFEGVPTICIFGGAHQRLEWQPVGRSVVTLSRAIACSPCHFHHAPHCPHGLACLDQISPDSVFETFMRLADRAGAERFADVG